MIYSQSNLLVPLPIKVAAYLLMFHVIISFASCERLLCFMWALESIHPIEELEIAPKLILLLAVNRSFGFQHFVVLRRGFYLEILGILRVLVCYSDAYTSVYFNCFLK